jgi:hypothetical protein
LKDALANKKPTFNKDKAKAEKDRIASPEPKPGTGNKATGAATNVDLCWRCGSNQHISKDCKMFNRKPTGHPDCNQAKTNWLQSEMGILYKRLRPSAPYLQYGQQDWTLLKKDSFHLKQSHHPELQVKARVKEKVRF